MVTVAPNRIWCFFFGRLLLLSFARDTYAVLGRSIVSWAVMVVQILLRAPFWPAAHILESIGFAGQHARRCYIMLLDLFMCPTLLCCAVIMSMLLLETITRIFGIILGQWVEITGLAAGYSFLGYFVL